MNRSVRLVLAAVIALAGSDVPFGADATGTGAGAYAAGPGAVAAVATPTIAQLVGQKLVVRMAGTTPSADLLGRIRRGEVGGVILFGSNITTAAALRQLTATLQAAATAGGRPRLLIAVYQEGGPVKRIPWAPPTLSPRRMGSLGSTTIARSQGAATGAALSGLGIDVDLAPVADVPASTASFMYLAGRTWSFNASRTSALANAFALGLWSRHVAPTLKHFPGIGYATRDTDGSIVSIRASRTALAPGLLPYRAGIANHLPLIMLSNATYTAWDPVHAAGWSVPIQTLLRRTLGFTGVTITDSLDGTAAVRGYPVSHLAILAASAGTDMILTTGSEARTRAVYIALVQAATDGRIPLANLRASYARILALKARR